MSNFRRLTLICALLLLWVLSLTWTLSVRAQTGPGTQAGRARGQSGEMRPAAWFPLIARGASFRVPNESSTPQPTGGTATTAVTGVPGITPPGSSTPVPATISPENTNTPAPDPQDT